MVLLVAMFTQRTWILPRFQPFCCLPRYCVRFNVALNAQAILMEGHNSGGRRERWWRRSARLPVGGNFADRDCGFYHPVIIKLHGHHRAGRIAEVGALCAMVCPVSKWRLTPIQCRSA